MKTREDKRMVKLDFFSFQISIYGHILKKSINFLVHIHSSWPTFGLHLMTGPKAL
jgi:hypothetical protein